MNRRVVLILPTVVLALSGLLAPLAPLTLPAAAASVDDPVKAQITAVMADPLVTASGTTVSTIVADGVDGHGIYLRNPTVALVPASTTKLFTAAAGLHYLGSGYRWKTETWTWPMRAGGVVPGNLYLKGYGDPTLMERDLAAVAASYKAKGVTRIAGSVMADTSFFDNVRYNPGWSTSYASSYYAAQVSALTLSPDTDYDAGTVVIGYSPGATTGSRARVSVTPASAASYVRLVNNATTSSTGSSSVTVTRSSGSNTITLSGTVPRGAASGKRWVTVNDPGQLAATVLRAQLVKAGIRVDGGVGTLSKTAGTVLYTTRSSMTLGQLLVPFLKLSNNGHAEVITKTLGTRAGRAGNWADGTALIKANTARYGIVTTGMNLVDGSGLSRSDRLTTLQMVQLVHRVQTESWFPTFKAALPVAGADPVRWTGGTLASRMRGTRATNNLRAKNGDLTGVTSLAGYVTGADGRPYVFATISSYSRSSPRPVEDRLGVLLAGWRSPGR
ncbi:D-alanyl-D-alanine carboxypeptidase/D-alanyl-D-alanine-endopeptidase [Humibacillus sp. DSM 29435]|uniref:D-alanyl-D-alanine carboxypeptidase/D-alanyl-D-alanine endopeptidase n=1 Tax=Humibacillus sp. DSM 29435 TaxID=1869167 RepID=UPI000A80F7AB|nr:D-alanyl-D-alanine carboxypeptidase/D-alanyl-D-alanine-endopeptidase [Humibacillus sp. DSM 29435]